MFRDRSETKRELGKYCQQLLESSELFEGNGVPYCLGKLSHSDGLSIGRCKEVSRQLWHIILRWSVLPLSCQSPKMKPCGIPPWSVSPPPPPQQTIWEAAGEKAPFPVPILKG